MRRILAVSFVVLLCALPLFAGAGLPAGSKIYIETMDGFENCLAAAVAKKMVQLTVVADKDSADFVVSGASGHQKVGRAKQFLWATSIPTAKRAFP
jgi:hypothetical protein